MSRVSDSVLGGATVSKETLHPRSDMLATSESRIAIKRNDRFIWFNNGDQNELGLLHQRLCNESSEGNNPLEAQSAGLSQPLTCPHIVGGVFSRI